MEISLMGRQAARVAEPGLIPRRTLALRASSRLGRRTSRVGFDFGKRRKGPARLALRAVRSEMVAEEKESPARGCKRTGPVRLLVGLPVDAVSSSNALNHGRAIAAGLKALKLLGADGVELPVFWGVVQTDSADSFDWSSYLALARMVRDAGLRLRVSLHLHASHNPAVPLPRWVTRIADADPHLLFTDRAGRHLPQCLSFAVDDLPVLSGRTALQAFEAFFQSFRSTFSDLFGSTITDVTVGLGPDGELRYPSFPASAGSHRGFTGVGEFQCYDKYMLAQLKQHAEASGNPLWGLTGPHDAPDCNQSPDAGNFFQEHGGSWETSYGDFFLSWYSGELLAHGNRLLSLASNLFGDLPVKISAKIPLLHRWHQTRSRPAQLTAGFYNTDGRDGYDAVAQVFAKNNCAMIIPGMDLADREQPQGLKSGPESLLAQIMRACEKHGVRVAGENASLTGGAGGFSKIKENLSAQNHLVADSFTYQRMGAQFFSPEHFPLFTEFVRSLTRPELDSEDLAGGEEEAVSLPMASLQGKDREMQAV